MTVTRRFFLRGVAPAALSPLLDACSGTDQTRVAVESGAPGRTGTRPWPRPAESPAVFLHGVASGDPLADGVILWTRVSPPQGSPPSAPLEVEWRVARDAALRDIVSDGLATTDGTVDFTVHIDVEDLDPGSTYYYQFRALGESSRVGRTKTLPDGAVERMRLGVASCANYPAGYFNAYAALARADVDLVLHLGDYIYEYANGVFGDGTPLGREPAPAHEIVSLQDYRARHAQYKTDPDLQDMHRQHPCAVVWDDHEIANNTWREGAQNHQAANEGDFQARKAAALRAYFEWLPIRVGAGDVIYRRLSCGDLLDLLLLDTRVIGRDVQVGRCEAAAIADPERSLLGSAQEAWLESELVRSRARGARWRVIGQQVIVAQVSHDAAGCVGNADAWDGYAATRDRLFGALEAGPIDNVVVLTGDAHSSWAIDVPRDPYDTSSYDPATGRGSRLVEFVTPGVSSPGSSASPASVLNSHPHVKFVDLSRQGYLVLDVTHERALAEWHFVETVRERLPTSELGAMMQTRAGAPYVISVSEAPPARTEQPELAP